MIKSWVCLAFWFWLVGDKAFSGCDLIPKGTTIVKEFWGFFLFCVFHEQEDCYIVVLLPYGAVPGCVWESCVEDTLKSSNFVWGVHEFEGIVVV